MTPTPNLQAAAMRAAAVVECTAGLKEAKEYNMLQMAMGYSACRASILALPLEATPAELLAEAVKLPEIAALIKAMQEIATFGDVGASDYLKACNSFILFDEPGSVETARAALSALETP